MKTLVKWLNTPIVLGVLLVAGFITDLVLLGRAYDLGKSDWAAWVGSVGTVATLAGTIWLATNDRRIRKREAQDLALVTISAYTMRLAETEIHLRVTAERLQTEVAMGAISDYRGVLATIGALPAWQPADLAPLVCLERHIAARIAFAAAHVESIRNAFEDAVATRSWNSTVTGSAQFNEMTIPRLRDVSQQLRDIVMDSMIVLQASGLSASMLPRTGIPPRPSATAGTR